MSATTMMPAESSAARSSSAHRETALRRRITELEDELRVRDDFLAIAAHELRNPMTPIIARLELLLERTRGTPASVPEAVAQGLEQLERLVDAYIRRATTLLEMSRITSGKLRLQRAVTDLSALMRQVTINMAPLAERAGCRLSLTVQDGISARCDGMAVEQILENLLSNAIRYGPGGVIEVVFASEGEMARLSVRDEGIGISVRDQAQIFERFNSLRRPSPKGGFGVGLWIARQLARAMGGEIAVRSSPGAGSTFTFEFPLWPREDHNGH